MIVEPFASLQSAHRQATTYLSKHGSETPALDARILIAWSVNAETDILYRAPDQVLQSAEHERLQHALGRRARAESVARIIGYRSFWTLKLQVTAHTLEPRPESELLIEQALQEIDRRLLRNAPLTIIDMGTGTGALLLSLLSECPNAFGIGTDLHSGALETARINAQTHGLADRSSFVRADMTRGLKLQSADIFLSNPPYIERDAIGDLTPTVREYDPHSALDGGLDGLDFYRHLAAALSQTPPRIGAWIEIGFDQSKAVSALFSDLSLQLGVLPDIAGQPRCVEFIPHPVTFND